MSIFKKTTTQDADLSDPRAKAIIGTAGEIIAICSGKDGASVPAGWPEDWAVNVKRMRQLIVAYQAFDEAVPARISAAIIDELEAINNGVAAGLADKAIHHSFTKAIPAAEFLARRGQLG